MDVMFTSDVKMVVYAKEWQMEESFVFVHDIIMERFVKIVSKPMSLVFCSVSFGS
jgi:hypothetical protein